MGRNITKESSVIVHNELLELAIAWVAPAEPHAGLMGSAITRESGRLQGKQVALRSPIPPFHTPATTCLLLLFLACLETFLRNRSNLSLWETPGLAFLLCFRNQTPAGPPYHICRPVF